MLPLWSYGVDAANTPDSKVALTRALTLLIMVSHARGGRAARRQARNRHVFPAKPKH